MRFSFRVRNKPYFISAIKSPKNICGKRFKSGVNKQNPLALVRCAAFDITDDQLSNQEELKEMLDGGLEIFPVDKEIDNGRSSVDFHMEVVLTNYFVLLLPSPTRRARTVPQRLSHQGFVRVHREYDHLR